MQTERWALLGPGSSCRVQISQATRLVSLKTDLCAVFPARRDELCLRLADLDAEASRLELGSSNPLDHPHTKTPPLGGAFLCGPPGESDLISFASYPILRPNKPRNHVNKFQITVYQPLQTLTSLYRALLFWSVDCPTGDPRNPVEAH